jgi:hypothetical protein
MRDLGLSQATYYTHFNLLLNRGYLSVEQRKSNGKYTVSLYRLSYYVDSPPTQPPLSPSRNEIRKAMSEKLAHGELLKASPATSEKAMSEKPLSEKSGHGNFGRPNINNNYTTNSLTKKEQDKNHQGVAPDDKKPVPLFSSEQAKEIMRYEFSRREAQAWGELKEKLGHFPSPSDKARYTQRTLEILDEIARQAHALLNSAQEPEHIAALCKSQAFADFFDKILTHRDEIRSAKGYVRAALENMRNHSG